MKKILNLFAALVLFCFLANLCWAGQNENAGIRFDLNSSTSGNQNQTSIGCPGTNTYIRVDIYVVNASNLDTYEFDINYNVTYLEFIGGAEDHPVTFEKNFLKKNSGSTIGFLCNAAGGLVNCTNSLVGNQGEDTPDGEGLLASIVFKCLVDCPGNLSFGDVDWYDNGGVKDACTDKGSDVSLPVELSTFSLSLNTDGVLLEWTTASEINNWGFNILRSLNDSTGYAQINPDLIEGQGNSSSGDSYSYVDETIQPEKTYFYKLEQVDISGVKTYFGPKSIFVSSAAILKFKIPDTYDLAQNYPNPFNPTTTIKYQLPVDTEVMLSIINLSGQKIATLINKNQAAGYHFIKWNGKDERGNVVSSGVYFYQLRTKSFFRVRKMVFLR